MKNTFIKLGNFLGTMIRKNFTSSNVLKIWAYSLLFVPVFMFVMRLAISDGVDEFVFTWFSLMVGSIILQFFINFVKKIKSGKFQYLYILIVLNITMFLSYILKNYSGDWMNDLSDNETVKKLLMALINAAFLFLIKTLVWIVLMLKWKQVKQNEENRILLEDKYSKLKKDNEVLLKEKDDLEKKYVTQLESKKTQYDNLGENIKQSVHEKSQKNEAYGGNNINEKVEKDSAQKNNFEYSSGDSDNEKVDKRRTLKKFGFKKNRKVSNDVEQKNIVKQKDDFNIDASKKVNINLHSNENPKSKNQKFGPIINNQNFSNSENGKNESLNQDGIDKLDNNAKVKNKVLNNDFFDKADKNKKDNSYSYQSKEKNFENKINDDFNAKNISNEIKKPKLNNLKLRSYNFESSNDSFKKNSEFNGVYDASKKENVDKDKKTDPWIDKNKSD